MVTDFEVAGALPVDTRTLHHSTKIAIIASNSDKARCAMVEVLRESRVLVVKGLEARRIMPE